MDQQKKKNVNSTRLPGPPWLRAAFGRFPVAQRACWTPQARVVHSLAPQQAAIAHRPVAEQALHCPRALARGPHQPRQSSCAKRLLPRWPWTTMRFATQRNIETNRLTSLRAPMRLLAPAAAGAPPSAAGGGDGCGYSLASQRIINSIQKHNVAPEGPSWARS